MYADDAKLYKFISTISDHQMLQEYFNELQKWSDKWQLKLSVTKCKVISFGRGNIAEYKYTITSENLAVPLSRDKYI